MPNATHSAPWEVGLRTSVRASTAVGWSLRESRGSMRLEVRSQTGRASVLLPFAWDRRHVADALVRVRNLYVLVCRGHSLSEAAAIASGAAPVSTRPWAEALSRFEQHKRQHGTAITAGTWKSTYAPVLTMAVKQLESRRSPRTPIDLLELCVRDWPPGSRTRQIRAQALAQFLRYCVERERFAADWLPPSTINSVVGRAPAGAVGHKGHPFSDAEILDLLNSFPPGELGSRWADVIRLLAELGLRPTELLHLSVRHDSSSGEPYWWCQYRKRSGGGQTAARRIHPLPLTQRDGALVQWHLLERWQAGLLPLPSLPEHGENCVGNVLGHYLRRRPGWRALQTALAARGERAVPYSFRHSYSLRGHRLGIDAGSLALSMGHSYDVHCRSYPWATERSTADAFRAALERRGVLKV